jgi:hypothetical protein
MLGNFRLFVFFLWLSLIFITLTAVPNVLSTVRT